MIITIDQASPVPPFEQLRGQLVMMIEGGTLQRGHRLPSVRQLASDLGLATGTVARAYRELESTGFVATNGRHGTTVQAVVVSRSSQRTRLNDAAELFVRTVRQLGATSAEAAAALRTAGFSDDD